MKKNDSKIYYDERHDILWLMIKSGPEEEYKEIAPGVGIELDKNGELIGIEILGASKILGIKPKLTQKPLRSISVAHKIQK